MSHRPMKPGAKEREPASVDSRGNQRVYIDLPGEFVRRFNVLAAMRGMSKRALLADLVKKAVEEAGIK